ncbi:hypothetical protein KD909_15090 (plasmid) [Exiguobacterium sp. PFWT01]|uniref:hypothetical protein n=1 Tax=Exiguobacterium sp. PFWT01 TaxID=2829816 RepID=UPI001BABFA9D|nr:hypothetical protein [Exiguobacterium sp. PFWT01]QUP88753.1 hypothetical protein KD909_15090 [Exiguobacterium sp. PFWT01]
MGWMLALIGAIGIGSSMLIKKSVIERIQEKRKYNSYLASDILLYVSEICTMFGIFLLVTENPIHTTQYRIKEDSLLKIFIDFFVIYQITLLIIFRLMDGHFINACQTMKHFNAMARGIVQRQNNAQTFLEGYKRRETEFTYAFPPEILLAYRDTMIDLERYQEWYQNNDLNDNIIDSYLYRFEMKDWLVNRLAEIKQDEWGVSILKRINTNIKLKKFRESNIRNTQS